MIVDRKTNKETAVTWTDKYKSFIRQKDRQTNPDKKKKN